LDRHRGGNRYYVNLSEVFEKVIMKFEHPKDTKMLILGVIASMSAVIIWDIIKKKNKIFNYVKEKV